MMNFCDAGSEAFKLMMNCAIGMSLQYKHDKSPSVTKLRARQGETKQKPPPRAWNTCTSKCNTPAWPFHYKQRMTSNYKIDDNHLPAQEWMARGVFTSKQFLNFLGWKGFKLMRYLPGYEQPFSGINHLVGVWSLNCKKSYRDLKASTFSGTDIIP